MNAPKLTSQPANVAQRNRVPLETNSGTVITSFDIVKETAKVEEHGRSRTIQWQSQKFTFGSGPKSLLAYQTQAKDYTSSRH